MPKLQMATALILIYLSNLFNGFSINAVLILFLAVVSTVGSDLLFTYIRKEKFFIPYAAFVSGIIIALAVYPNIPIYGIISIGIIAMGVKNFVRFSNRHIFNPAATGLIIGSLILQHGVGWWGVSFQNILDFNIRNLVCFIILLTPLWVSCYRMRRFYSAASFLIIYSILNLIIYGFSINNLFPLILNPTIIFFSIVMLPEPMTSPIKINYQIIYGSVIALLAQMLSLSFVIVLLSLHHIILDPLLVSLLIGNLIFFKLR